MYINLYDIPLFSKPWRKSAVSTYNLILKLLYD